MNREKNLGDKIKEIRKQKGYTQERLAELVEIDAKNLSKIENNAHLPSFKTLKKLSEILGFSLSDFDNASPVVSISDNLFYKKALKILNTSSSNTEIQNYYEVLKIAHKLMNTK